MREGRERDKKCGNEEKGEWEGERGKSLRVDVEGRVRLKKCETLQKGEKLFL